jgi:hypothetical protein
MSLTRGTVMVSVELLPGKGSTWKLRVQRAHNHMKVLWNVHRLLGDDREEILECTEAVARQRPANKRGMVFSARSAK